MHVMVSGNRPDVVSLSGTRTGTASRAVNPILRLQSVQCLWVSDWMCVNFSTLSPHIR